jgi:hypothetical protein
MPTVIQIQNTCITLAWQYLLDRYDHRRAVLASLNLVSNSIRMNAVVLEVSKHQHYNDAIDTIIRKTEDTFAALD